LEHKRAVILMISVGGGLRIPLMEGDKIRTAYRDNKTIHYWFPLCHDGNTIDLSRSKKGNRSERYLHSRFMESLRRGSHLIAVNATDFVVRATEPGKAPTGEVKQAGTEFRAAQPAVTEKRRPLLRLPVWGLPPRWH
jgi:hypothetical protein